MDKCLHLHEHVINPYKFIENNHKTKRSSIPGQHTPRRGKLTTVRSSTTRQPRLPEQHEGSNFGRTPALQAPNNTRQLTAALRHRQRELLCNKPRLAVYSRPPLKARASPPCSRMQHAAHPAPDAGRLHTDIVTSS